MGIAIFNRRMGMKLEPLAEGTLAANGTEQTLVENNIISILTGYIDLDEMQIGDTVVVRQYIMINGTESLYAQETFSGAQTEPALHIQRRPSKDKIKITLQQTAGTYRNFNYEFIREV